MKVWLGFTEDDVKKFIENDKSSVPLVVKVVGNCVHRKNFTYHRVQGDGRRTIKKKHMYDSSGALADVKASKIHDCHNNAINPLSKSNMKKIRRPMP